MKYLSYSLYIPQEYNIEVDEIILFVNGYRLLAVIIEMEYIYICVCVCSIWLKRDAYVIPKTVILVGFWCIRNNKGVFKRSLRRFWKCQNIFLNSVTRNIPFLVFLERQVIFIVILVDIVHKIHVLFTNIIGYFSIYS